MSTPSPSDYVAVVELTNRDGEVLAAPGETCERVAPLSLAWLVEQGLIVLAEKERA